MKNTDFSNLLTSTQNNTNKALCVSLTHGCFWSECPVRPTGQVDGDRVSLTQVWILTWQTWQMY